MKTSKKLFLALALIFFMAMIYVGYDISSRTTFPGSKSQLKKRIEQDYIKKDSVVQDTIGLQ
ncbi:MAG: hypothetical protein MJA30_27590 [Cytophagales bacterium]|nr:hypothetical protein [Cytophagales bacterium]